MKLFQKRQEDFKCEHCGHEVKGSGYTNHCPRCLYSKHVDLNPGDRLNNCLGLMQPIEVERKHNEYTIIHKCIRCGMTKKNKAAPDDNFDEIIRISRFAE